LKKIINRVEKYIIRFAVLSMVLMVIAQGLMTADPIRFFLSWGERMEGENLELPASIAEPESSTTAGEVKSPQARFSITVDKFSSLPLAKILVNGKEKYAFTAQPLTVEANAGDTIEIDSTAYNFPLNYKIGSVSTNLAYPQRGQSFAANQTIVMLGKIIVK